MSFLEKMKPGKLCKVLIACSVLLLGACVYRPHIIQGNYLDEELVGKVQVGMTRNQIRFLLGTPMVRDPFHVDRWDYVYYFKHGRSGDVILRRLVVFFDGDQVREFLHEEAAPS